MIRDIKCCFQTAILGLKKWADNYRMIMLLLLLTVTIAEFCSNLNDFSDSINAQTNAIAVLPHLYNNQYFRLSIQFGIVLLFSNAPFRNENSLFCLVRIGYTKWCIGQIIYIIVSSFVYVLVIFMLTIICIFPTLDFSLIWGKTFSTLAQTSAGLINIDYKILLLYDPFGAFANTFILLVMISVIIGLLIFMLSSIFGKGMGILAATALVLLGLLPQFCSNPTLIAKLSPCSLTQIALLDNTGISGYPTVLYAYLVLGALIAFLIVAVIVIYSNKKIKHFIYAMEV